MWFDCRLEIELAQVVSTTGRRVIEATQLVDKSSRYTTRFCLLVSGLCRYMSISRVAQHLNLRWETVKNIDKRYLSTTLPALDPSQLIGVETGRTAAILTVFLKQLPLSTAKGIQAVAMDMGPAYQKAVRECLPHTDIVFDRFHVMQN